MPVTHIKISSVAAGRGLEFGYSEILFLTVQGSRDTAHITHIRELLSLLSPSDFSLLIICIANLPPSNRGIASSFFA